MPQIIPGEEVVSKLVVIRLALAGALVAVSVAELMGWSSTASSQLVAGSLGAAAVWGLKAAHFL